MAETLEWLQQLSDELLKVEALAREAVSDVQMSLSRGKKDKYTSYNSVLSTVAVLKKAYYLTEDLKYLRDSPDWQSQVPRGFEELTRSLEGMSDELKTLESRLESLSKTADSLLLVSLEYDEVIKNPTYSKEVAVAECWQEGKGGQVSCTGDVGVGELSREAVELSERLLSSEPVRLLELEGRKLSEMLESDEITKHHIEFVLMNIDTLKKVLSTHSGEQQIEWAPYRDALKLAYATEKLRNKLFQICMTGNRIRTIKWITRLGRDDEEGDEEEEEEFEGVAGQKLKRLAEAMNAACTLEDLARDVARSKYIDRETTSGGLKSRRLIAIQTEVSMKKEYIDAFRNAREALGRPVGWFIPNAREGEKLKPTAVVNDLANYVHVVAEEIKKLSIDTADNCILERDTNPLLVEVCRSWSTSASINSDDYSSEDTPALIGYASGKKLYLRVGSAPGHATVIEKLNGKARVEYYDSDEPVMEVMMSLLEDIVGCRCEYQSESERSVCSCPLETEDDAVRLGAVISRATSMDYRYADYYNDVRDSYEQEYESEEEENEDNEEEEDEYNEEEEWYDEADIREEAIDKLYHDEKSIVEDTIEELLKNKRSSGNRITSTSNLLMAEIITR